RSRLSRDTRSSSASSDSASDLGNDRAQRFGRFAISRMLALFELAFEFGECGLQGVEQHAGAEDGFFGMLERDRAADDVVEHICGIIVVGVAAFCGLCDEGGVGV